MTRPSRALLTLTLLAPLACQSAAREPAPAASVVAAPLAVPAPIASTAGRGPAPSAAAAPNAAEPREVGATCASICQRSKTLGCSHAAACIETCQAMATSPVCPDKIRAMLSCIDKQPVVHWECDEKGIAAIKDGFCDAEQSAFSECASALAK